METLKSVPNAIIGPALLAWYKAIHYQIPDPGPIEVNSQEAAKLALEVVKSVAAYLPEGELARVIGEHAATERATAHNGGFRQEGVIEIYSEGGGDGPPGCCVQIGGRLVCVRAARAH